MDSTKIGNELTKEGVTRYNELLFVYKDENQ